nr:ATP synthase F0 subunit 8 [Incisitermes snyderi]
MPQMMPLSWLMLFLTFSTTLILFSTMNYYTTTSKTKTSVKTEVLTTNMNWKW